MNAKLQTADVMSEIMNFHRKDQHLFTAKGWQYKTVIQRVRVIAQAEGYAMVRDKGDEPFVVSVKDLHEVPKETT